MKDNYKNNAQNDKHKQKAKALVAKMTIEECASQLLFKSKAIPHLDIPEYNWWNEAAHGVARAGMATVFPQPIGLAATFDAPLIKEVAMAISDEARAKYNAYRSVGDRGIYKGLTFWTPNVNIFRDPRWGRGQETYGEDPFLTSELGVAFVEGLQGDDPEYMKSAACAKHYAVHSGPENQRHSFNALATPKDMHETYLPAFKALVDAGVEGVMGAYNRTNGEPCCGSKTLLQDILVDTWGFDGYITSDCWAIADFHLYHKVTKNANESIALALTNGCHLNCGNIYEHMMDSYKEGLISEAHIRDAAIKVMTTRVKLGMFEPHIAFDDIAYDVVDCDEHRKLNLDVAKKSLVLLKNNNLLPINKNQVRQVAVIGPNANSIRALEGNYHGTANQYHTVLESIREEFTEAKVTYSVGSHLHAHKLEDPGYDGDRLGEVKTHVALSDLVVLVVGLDESIESEDKGGAKPGFSGDKEDLLLPQSQRSLITTVMEGHKPTIIVCLSGSSIDLGDGNKADAIIQGWYPGAMGGKAIASLITGGFSPSGKLPVTFYRNDNTLPHFEDYSMHNRTYKFYTEDPLYPFGFGLSFTSFTFTDLKIQNKKIQAGDPIKVEVTVGNSGSMDGEEVVQFYCKDLESKTRVPRHSLCAMQRVHVKKGEKKTLQVTIPAEALLVIGDDGKPFYEIGEFILYAGSCQPDAYSMKLMGSKECVAEARFVLVQ